MFNWLTEERFKKLAMWAIYTMLFCQAFPLIYFNYSLDNPVTRNFWIAGMLVPALVSVIGIIRPDLAAKSLSGPNEDPAESTRRGRLIAILTFLLFSFAILYLRFFY